MNTVGDPGGTDSVRIESDSPLVGRTLRHSAFPISVIVTTIQRRQDLVVPNGSTVLEAGDELVLIGQSTDIARHPPGRCRSCFRSTRTQFARRPR